MHHALEQIDIFYEEVLGKNQAMKQMTSWSDLDDLQDGEIGAVLTLEGADAFGNDVVKLRHLYRVGVMSVGLTWNIANLFADGAGEPRRGGLTLLGYEIVRLNNYHHVFKEVSHFTDIGFSFMIESAYI